MSGALLLAATLLAGPVSSDTVRIEYEANPHQLEVLESDKRVIFLGGGVGVGKTDTGSLKMLQWASAAPEGVLHLIAANTYPQLYDSTLRNVYKNWSAWGVRFKPDKLPRSHSPLNLQVSNGSHWVEILCRSLDHYETLAGIEIGRYWLDEVYQTKPEAFGLVVARCRDTRVENQGLLTTTLDDPASWMYDRFVDNYDAERDLVIYAPTKLNARNLPASYVEDLKAQYTEREYQRMVEAKWVSLEGGQIYYAFDRDTHVTEEAEWTQHLPVHWTHDFNVGEGKPMSSLLLQVGKGAAPDGAIRTEIRVFDEIVIDSADTHDAIAEFHERKWADPEYTIILGDASGKARDTRSKTSDYQILKDAGFVHQKVPSANPPIRTRHNTVNALLKAANGDVRIKVHPRCKVLAKGLETVKLRGGAQYLEKETYEQHVTTALGYAACELIPMRGTPPKGGRVIRRMAA